MHELIITPKIYTNVSQSAQKFIGAVARETQIDPKIHEYLGVSTLMPQIQKTGITRHLYFKPTANINPNNEQVAKFIRIG